jgi:hypothetical protein
VDDFLSEQESNLTPDFIEHIRGNKTKIGYGVNQSKGSTIGQRVKKGVGMGQ